ncbi:MAG: hypothetical protein AVDCRST_MAG49-464 [uncultured Thermomicrobiales bacterium]|uniref:HTH lacI-type domain-containing protein n=1 Tax=uncultured Thermomicrobiales bacterium TaxID=1645740 RepID=A0A6J4U3G6_9BACT|nr:MAG: hypothetical protein AVDCRST_MAG49-464 [uncultured Thermomicrobiales bacterium]
MTHVSLKDVAGRAGVSFQTTSKVLNGKGTVAPETRARILGAAKDLGYVPNALARSLLTRSTCTIGVVASDLSNAVLSQLVVGIEREARQHGHVVIICSIDYAGSNGERELRVLLERRVDGIITVAPRLELEPQAGDLLRGPVPAVTTHPIAGGGIPLVAPDHRRAALEATRHLVALGHRRIGTVTGPRNRHPTLVRLDGYRRALEEVGVPFDPGLTVEGDWSVEEGYRAGHRLLDHAPDTTAVFAQNDLMAVGLLAALHERGLDVPADCAVVGCDDIAVAARMVPPLTTVHIPFHEAGTAAARLLLDLIAGRVTDPAAETLLPVRLVRRASCGLRPTAGLGGGGTGPVPAVLDRLA